MTIGFNDFLIIDKINDQNDLSGAWHHHLGWIAYHFAQLEWASYWLADGLGSLEFCESIAETPFVERCKIVRTEIVPLIADQNLRRDWKSLFGKMMNQAPMRNNILHNPLEVRMDQMNVGGITASQGIMLMRNRGQRILPDKVQIFSDELKKLHIKMIELMKRTTFPT